MVKSMRKQTRAQDTDVKAELQDRTEVIFTRKSPTVHVFRMTVLRGCASFLKRRITRCSAHRVWEPLGAGAMSDA